MTAGALSVYLSGRLAGVVRRGPHGGIILRYEESWVQDPLSYPLSLSLPLDESQFKPQRVEDTLAGLLPESRETLEDWRRRYRIKDIHDPLQVLAAVGMDVAGAAQFSKDSGGVAERGSSLDEVSESEMAEMIRESRENAGAMPMLEAVPRVSLAGQQSKFALAKVGGRWHIPRGNAPSTHIFKPAPRRLRDVDVAELAVMRAAQAAGLRVAISSVERIGGEAVFISERYDRVPTSGGGVARVHQEDMVQALGLPVARKYQRDGGAITLPRMIGLLHRHASADDIDEFIRLTAFNVAVGNADAHGKNHSVLIQPRGGVELAPAYDLISVAPYPAYDQSLALSVGRQWQYERVGLADWRKFAQDSGLDADRVLLLVAEVWARVPDAMAEALVEAGVPKPISTPILAVTASLPERTKAIRAAVGS